MNRVKAVEMFLRDAARGCCWSLTSRAAGTGPAARWTQTQTLESVPEANLVLPFPRRVHDLFPTLPLLEQNDPSIAAVVEEGDDLSDVRSFAAGDWLEADVQGVAVF